MNLGPQREWRDRSVTVMGLGLQGGGVEVVRFLAARGARVTVTDQRSEALLAESLRAIADLDVRTVLGQHRVEDFSTAEVVVANPAVAPSHPLLAAARAAGAWVTSEMALFLDACPARVVAITGTQGKSSTTHATARLLEECGHRVHLGGNIGRALLGEVELMRADDIAVVEISSYQLEALPQPCGSVARVEAVACVNVLADHLERHGSVENYDAAKRRILELAHERTTVVLSGEDPRVSQWRVERGRELRFGVAPGRSTGLHIADGEFRVAGTPLGRVEDLRLPGAFQRANMLAALGLSWSMGAEPAALATAVARVSGLEHRLQDLGLFAGHRVWDNAISTTPDSTISALEALSAPLTLVCGGQAKNLPLEELAGVAARRARHIVTFGGSAELLCERFRAAGARAQAAPDVERAVAAAFAAMEPGEELLFSPACASFDAYRNFGDRARAFRAALPRA
ncbi:MAG: UDP-N-acetylmuramoyl-L-alanine--D-glutamate ligase [Planctomycetes bacterium]|nr:UDP-N-acetylmuramoyl-L-alanine--D-glutamate ligase [Planctomycetota bacterium]